MSQPSKRKFGYAFGTGMTIFIFILDFLVILTTVSNCIVYNKIASGEPNNDISQGWARFLLAVNIIIAICAFVIFFWILYILFTGKKSIGDEILRKRELGLSAYLSDVAGDVRSRGEDAAGRLRQQVEGFGNRFNTNTGYQAVGDGGDADLLGMGNATPARVLYTMEQLKAATDIYDNFNWDNTVNRFGGDCNNPFNRGCSQNLKCSDGETTLPCFSGSRNDPAVNTIYRKVYDNTN